MLHMQTMHCQQCCWEDQESGRKPGLCCGASSSQKTRHIRKTRKWMRLAWSPNSNCILEKRKRRVNQCRTFLPRWASRALPSSTIDQRIYLFLRRTSVTSPLLRARLRTRIRRDSRNLPPLQTQQSSISTRPRPMCDPIRLRPEARCGHTGSVLLHDALAQCRTSLVDPAWARTVHTRTALLAKTVLWRTDRPSL